MATAPVLELTPERRLRAVMKEVCEHLETRLHLEVVYDALADRPAFAALKRAKDLLKELAHA